MYLFSQWFSLRRALLKTTGQDAYLCAGSSLQGAQTTCYLLHTWTSLRAATDPTHIGLLCRIRPATRSCKSLSMVEVLFLGYRSEEKLGAFPLCCRLINTELSGKMHTTAKDTYFS